MLILRDQGSFPLLLQMSISKLKLALIYDANAVKASFAYMDRLGSVKIEYSRIV